MIDRSRLRELHGDELPLHILEEDYLQALFLQELYREADPLVFKGGTFLKHAHGLDRFSEDLDFTRTGASGISTILETAAAALERYGIPAELDHVERSATTVRTRLRYDGPLYDGSSRSRGRINLDVSMRDDLIRDAEWRRLFFPYPETRVVTARCLQLEEAFAEKLRALSTRTRGRDLYDCWFLLQQGVTIEPALFEQKMAVVEADPVVRLTITAREWDRDLAVLLEAPPDYDAVVEPVTSALHDVGIPVET